MLLGEKQLNLEIGIEVNQQILSEYSSIESFWDKVQSKYKVCTLQSLYNKISGKTAFKPYELYIIENELSLEKGSIYQTSLDID